MRNRFLVTYAGMGGLREDKSTRTFKEKKWWEDVPWDAQEAGSEVDTDRRQYRETGKRLLSNTGSPERSTSNILYSQLTKENKPPHLQNWKLLKTLNNMTRRGKAKCWDEKSGLFPSKDSTDRALHQDKGQAGHSCWSHIIKHVSLVIKTNSSNAAVETQRKKH